MLCIFCKSSSIGSVSIEHIVPESLGNTLHTLPRGIVCDKCNNYFARKIEKTVLDSEYFTQERFYNCLPNKRGRIPVLENILGSPGISLEMMRERDGFTHLYPTNEKDSNLFLNFLKTHQKGALYIPVPKKVDSYLISRFLAKIALEILALRVMNHSGWEKEVIFREELDDLRDFVRYGDPRKRWEFYERKIYDFERPFQSEGEDPYQVLHEFNLLYTRKGDLLAVIAILGIEYTISLVNPQITSYKEWLEENDHKSPLYLDGNLNLI